LDVDLFGVRCSGGHPSLATRHGLLRKACLNIGSFGTSALKVQLSASWSAGARGSSSRGVPLPAPLILHTGTPSFMPTEPGEPCPVGSPDEIKKGLVSFQRRWDAQLGCASRLQDVRPLLPSSRRPAMQWFARRAVSGCDRGNRRQSRDRTRVSIGPRIPWRAPDGHPRCAGVVA
jgi:hypothetical protein